MVEKSGRQWRSKSTPIISIGKTDIIYPLLQAPAAPVQHKPEWSAQGVVIPTPRLADSASNHYADRRYRIPPRKAVLIGPLSKSPMNSYTTVMLS
ncbi:hypothetical protein Trydic_g21642 [Trypoxylus dichotomus]